MPPPQVITSAVDRLLPLMNADSQQQWRMLPTYLREQALGLQLGRASRCPRLVCAKLKQNSDANVQAVFMMMNVAIG